METIFIKRPDGRLNEALYDSQTATYTVQGIIDDPRLVTVAQYPELTVLGKGDWAGSGHTTTIDDVYNQLILTCDIDEVDDVVDSPLSEDDMYSPFRNRQLYAQENCAWGSGTDSVRCWKQLLNNNGKTGYNFGEVYNHYIQVYKSRTWEFSGDKFISDFGENQSNVLFEARKRSNLFTGFLCSFGHDEPASVKDNSMKSKLNMDNYLVISVNGFTNRNSTNSYKSDEEDDPGKIYPSEEEVRDADIPIAKYVGNRAGGYISPTDDESTNFFIISGKMFLDSSWRRNSRPRSYSGAQEYDYARTVEFLDRPFDMSFWTDIIGQTVHLDNSKNGDGCYYTVKFFEAASPEDDPVPVTQKDRLGVMPRNSGWDKPEMGDLTYGWSANGEEVDRIRKLPLIQCTLKVGDKYCCEVYNEDGESSYEWHTIDDPSMPYDEYNGERQPRNHIYIGFDPAIDDQFIGAKEWSLTNTVRPEYNIDEEGICIPVKASDRLSGDISFTIDAMCHLTWDHITRRHPSFWRHTAWYHNIKYVLAHIQTVFIKDFGIKIVSDQGGMTGSDQDKDLVYMTDEVSPDKYINKLDDIEFRISTALTTQECREKGIKQAVRKCNPYVGDEPLRSLYNTVTGNEAKAEELYLDDWWREFTEPKILFDAELRHTAETDWISQYRCPSLGAKDFLI